MFFPHFHPEKEQLKVGITVIQLSSFVGLVLMTFDVFSLWYYQNKK